MPAPTTSTSDPLSAGTYQGTSIPGTSFFPQDQKQALLVSSSPARSVTADNINTLQKVTAPAPAPTDTKTPSTSTTATQTTLAQDQQKAANQGKPGYDVLGNPISGYVAPTGTNADGTTPDQYDAAVKGIKDPGLAAQYKTSLQALDSQLAQAHTNMDNAAALSQNDPAALAAIAGIKAKYDQQIQLMRDRNTQLIGKANTSVAAFGGLGVMGQDFLNDQQSRADQRVSALQAQEQDAVTKMQIAYQTKDFKALDTATKAYDAANKGKLDALGKLLTETNKAVDQAQKQQKIDQAQVKQTNALDISKSNNLALGIAQQIKDAGLTGSENVDKFIAGVAKEYGITNPDILESAVIKAQQANDKGDLANENTKSIIASRKAKGPGGPSAKGNGTDGTYKYTQADIDSYSGLLNQGGTGPDGSQYNARGADGYVDPQAYLAALKDWLTNQGTPAGFAKKFPVKANINPASYDKLPEALQPKIPTINLKPSNTTG